MTFPASDQASILTDLSHMIRGGREFVGRTFASRASRATAIDTVTGFHLVNGWGKERYLYFAAKYSRPFDQFAIIATGSRSFTTRYRFRSSREAFGPNSAIPGPVQDEEERAILVKAAVSAVSAAQCPEESRRRDPATGTSIRSAAKPAAKWERELSTIQIEGSQARQGNLLHGDMYHCLHTPNLYRGRDRRIPRAGHNIHRAKGFTNYAVFSLWDTYRAEHPLFTLIQQQRDADMINSMLAHYDQSVEHLLPVWSLQGNETWCMIGYHAVPVIADAYLKGVRGFDAQAGLPGDEDHGDESALRQRGHLRQARLGAVRQGKRVGLETLEYAYDDYCIAQMAKALGKTDDYKYFMKRAASYRNVFDPSIGLMRGKDSHGHVANAVRSAPVRRRRRLHRGHRLAILLVRAAGRAGPDLADGRAGKVHRQARPALHLPAEHQQGRRGHPGPHRRILARQRAQPPHHLPLLLRRPALEGRSSALHEVIKTQYGNQPNSLSGNDDCGQMSAWYIFTALGFYPVCPGERLLRHRQPGRAEGRGASLQRQDALDHGPEPFGQEHLRPIAASSTASPGPRPSCPTAKSRTAATLVFTMGPAAEQAMGRRGRLAGVDD